jgi:hypothetical protein
MNHARPSQQPPIHPPHQPLLPRRMLQLQRIIVKPLAFSQARFREQFIQRSYEFNKLKIVSEIVIFP